MIKRLMLMQALLLLSVAAFAHRLNEYLEAATISLSREAVRIELRLTPGTDVAAQVLKDIDLDRDNHISAKEQQAYIGRLGRDLSLTLDGRNTILKPVSYSFPAIGTMRQGTGDILLEFEIKIERQAATHQLTLKNNHYSPIAVYLVNCLLPSDTGIHVINQDRSADQSFYQLDFTIGGTQPAMQVGRQQLMDRANYYAVVKTYFVHGISHILTGYDHLLFLCALILGVGGLWDLIKIITAFTIAHSITLTLATLGYVQMPGYIIEPLIAASIIFVAVQNILRPQYAGSTGRLAVAFLFGLVHGLGLQAAYWR